MRLRLHRKLAGARRIEHAPRAARGRDPRGSAQCRSHAPTPRPLMGPPRLRDELGRSRGKEMGWAGGGEGQGEGSPTAFGPLLFLHRTRLLGQIARCSVALLSRACVETSRRERGGGVRRSFNGEVRRTRNVRAIATFAGQQHPIIFNELISGGCHPPAEINPLLIVLFSPISAALSFRQIACSSEVLRCSVGEIADTKVTVSFGPFSLTSSR